VMPALPELGAAEEDAVSQAILYVRTHYSEPLSLEDLARVVSLSPGYLSRKFSEHTGTGFRRYLIWVRVEAAKLLLTNTELTVRRIAEAVGYMDANYFSVRFKRETGESPRAYRLRGRGDV